MSTNLKEFGSVSISNNYQRHTYADLIVDYLVQIGVEYVFGVPGGAIEPFYNALARRARCTSVQPQISPLSKVLSRKTRRSGSRLQAIVARHEAGAAFMADGYARETGMLGVCCATTGPGTTNLITGVASAYADRIPMLVITAQTALPSFGSHGLQESSSDVVDTVGMFEHCTRYNSLVSHTKQLERKLVSALVCAFQRPRGPVHLSIPMDIQRSPLEGYRVPLDVSTLFRQPEVVDTQSFDALCETVLMARQIVLFVGNDCKEIIDLIIPFAELVGATIVSSPTGKRWVNPYHCLFRGVFGFAGHASAREALLDDGVDMVLAVGTDLDELSTGGWDQEALLNDKLVHIDATRENFLQSPMARLHVYGHLRTIFQSLIEVVTAYTEREQSVFGRDPFCRAREATIRVRKNHAIIKNRGIIGMPNGVALDSADKCLSDRAPIKPQRLMLELSRRFPENTRFLPDAGNSWAWTTHFLHLRDSENYRIGMGFGAMTWAIGAAIGTAFGSRGTPVVCITGDGSFLMGGQELTVAVQNELPVIFVLLNDQALGMVKHGQRMGGAEPIGFELPPVDFSAVARAMGAQAFTIRGPDDIAALNISEICSDSKPTLLNVYIDDEEAPPMKARVDVLDSSKSEDG